MVEINKLLCGSRIFSLKSRVHSLVMDGATAQLDLQIRVDGLRDDLIFVCGNLKKNGYDYTMTLEPLLRDTEPVSHELVQRLTVRLQSLQEKMSLVKLTHERPSDEISLKSPAVPVPVKNPTPIAAKTETKARKRQRLNDGSTRHSYRTRSGRHANGCRRRNPHPIGQEHFLKQPQDNILRSFCTIIGWGQPARCLRKHDVCRIWLKCHVR